MLIPRLKFHHIFLSIWIWLNFANFISSSSKNSSLDDLLWIHESLSSPLGHLDQCPPCFNCNLEEFSCLQYASCRPSTGTCTCPPGFGGSDCADPLCGSLAKGKNRELRNNSSCTCDDGWAGINCNVCIQNTACNSLVPNGLEAVCHTGGVTIHQNHHMCDVTNKRILDTLAGRRPQATFSCTNSSSTCDFQFWIDQIESFYCQLNQCTWKFIANPDQNVTTYSCEHMKCSCIPGRMLCGESGSVDVGQFLKKSIKGPATFESTTTKSGETSTIFSEPFLNLLIRSIFGDKSIFLSCFSGECLVRGEIPGYVNPVKIINTPLISIIITCSSLILIILIVSAWYHSRRISLQRSHGSIRLPNDDHDNNESIPHKLLDNSKDITLSFKDLSYNLDNTNILNNIMGFVGSGQVTAILGASGAGKTTLLDILARRNKRGIVSGDMLINGEKFSDPDFREMIGFVDQDDVVLSTLTVHEVIMDNALLRLPKTLSYNTVEQRVFIVEQQLGIYHIRNKLIGSEEGGQERGISGGEKRRIAIACELVTCPSILFLDEPTSGLDASNALNVMECLVNLAKNYNRTIVLTIHQPRSNIVAMFDQLILLAQGYAVYSGPFNLCQSYFASIGYSCPPGFNIADYLVDLTIFPRQFITTSFLSEGSSTTFTAGDPEIDDPHPSICRNTNFVTCEDNHNPSNFGTISTYSRKAVRRPGGYYSSAVDDENLLQNQSNTVNQQWVKLSRKTTATIENEPSSIHNSYSRKNLIDIDYLIEKFNSSEISILVKKSFQNFENESRESLDEENALSFHQCSDLHSHTNRSSKNRVGLLRQIRILSMRTWRNLYRDPLLLMAHYLVVVVLSVVLGYFFYALTDDIKGFQNRLGLFFFLLAFYGFSSLTSLMTFMPERLLFMRERAKGFYHPFAYFISKVIFDFIPLRLIPPIFMGIILYPMTGLYATWSHFLRFILFLEFFNLAAAALSFFVGILCQNAGMANLTGCIVMLISLLFSGFLLNRETMPGTIKWIQHLSIFHFAFEGLIVNEVVNLELIDHKYGLNIQIPGAAILSSFGFDTQALSMDCIGLIVFSVCSLTISYITLHVVLVERR